MINASNFPQESAEAFMDLAVTLVPGDREGHGDRSGALQRHPDQRAVRANGPFDRLDQFFRVRSYTADQFEVKYPDHTMPADKLAEWQRTAAPRTSSTR